MVILRKVANVPGALAKTQRFENINLRILAGCPKLCESFDEGVKSNIDKTGAYSGMSIGKRYTLGEKL